MRPDARDSRPACSGFRRASGPARTSRTSRTSRDSAGTRRRDRSGSRGARRAGAGASRSRSGSRSGSCSVRTTRLAWGARRRSGSSAPSRSTRGSCSSSARGRRVTDVATYANYQLISERGHGHGWVMLGRLVRLRRSDAVAGCVPGAPLVGAARRRAHALATAARDPLARRARLGADRRTPLVRARC